ncbi:MAG: N-acetyltransferase [Candidatus Omnitrophota bacterium]|nr:N-acetyltransferase [Candidatus Omnitrophota bacterium]
MREQNIFIHPTAIVDAPAVIGAGTKIWHFSHVMKDACIGEGCTLGQNVFVGSRVLIGNHVKIQNNVSIYEGVELEDDVFCGPSCVFTNDTYFRAGISLDHNFERTLVRRGASLGANATIICGLTVGMYAMAAAGAVVTRDVADYALVMGVPARRCGWVSRHGRRLEKPNKDGIMLCPVSRWRYREVEPGLMRCLDWSEDSPLPETSPSEPLDYMHVQ